MREIPVIRLLRLRRQIKRREMKLKCRSFRGKQQHKRTDKRSLHYSNIAPKSDPFVSPPAENKYLGMFSVRYVLHETRQNTTVDFIRSRVQLAKAGSKQQMRWIWKTRIQSGQETSLSISVSVADNRQSSCRAVRVLYVRST